MITSASTAILAAQRHDYLLSSQLGIKQSLRQQVKHMRYIAGSCSQPLRDEDIIQKSKHRVGVETRENCRNVTSFFASEPAKESHQMNRP